MRGQLRYLNEFYEVTAISGSGKDLEEVQKREGVKTQIIEMQREISPLKDLVALYHLYCFFKKEQPDIVHSVTPKAGLLSMVAARLAGVPVRMHTFTGLIFPSKKGILKAILIWMDRLLAKSATHIYPEGKGVKEDLIKYRITGKPLKIIANGNVNGINTTYFNRDQISANKQRDLKEALGISENDFVFIFVGRLVKDKGINELIHAFKNLASTPLSEHALNLNLNQSTPHPASNIQHPASPQLQPKLLLVGSLEQHLDPLKLETLKEIESNPHILSVGFQQDVRSYFAISNALVFPSYREGFPNVVLQAGAMGLPSIVSDINGCNEIIEDQFNGSIIPVKDAKSLGDAMKRFLEDEELRTALTANSREMVIDKYCHNKVWKALLEEYNKAVNH